VRFQIQKDPEPQNDSTVEVLANTVSIVEQLKEKKSGITLMRVAILRQKVLPERFQSKLG